MCVYELYRKDRGTAHDGGVDLYIRYNSLYEVYENFNTQTDAELCWIKVKSKYQNALVISSMCRPPNATQEYYNIMLDSCVTCVKMACNSKRLPPKHN